MTQSRPWICFHAPWRERSRSGMVVLERIQRFLAAVAVDPAPERATLSVYEDLDPELGRRMHGKSWRSEALPEVMESVGYRPGPLVAEAAEAMAASGATRTWQAGPYGHKFSWESKGPFDPDPLISLYRRHEADPPVAVSPSKRGVALELSHWFEVKRPSEAGPLFPGAQLRSSVLVLVDSRRANLSLRYDSPDMTVALRQAHTEIVAALGPKTPPHALQRIIPATKPGARERREPIS